MKLFNIGLPGQTQTLFVAKDKQDAFDRRTEVDHTFDFLPVEIKEVKVEGYEIHLTKVEEVEEEEFIVQVLDEPLNEPPEEEPGDIPLEVLEQSVEELVEENEVIEVDNSERVEQVTEVEEVEQVAVPVNDEVKQETKRKRSTNKNAK